MTKNFVEEPFCVSENFCYRKMLGIREGGYQDFPSKTFCLTVPKIFVGEPFSVSLISGIEKFYAYEGNITIFYRKFVVSQYRKIRWGTFLGFTKFLVSKNVRDKRGGGYHHLPSKLFCLTVPNHLVEEPICVSESFGYRKILCPRGEYHDFL